MRSSPLRNREEKPLHPLDLYISHAPFGAFLGRYLFPSWVERFEFSCAKVGPYSFIFFPPLYYVTIPYTNSLLPF